MDGVVFVLQFKASMSVCSFSGFCFCFCNINRYMCATRQHSSVTYFNLDGVSGRTRSVGLTSLVFDVIALSETHLTQEMQSVEHSFTGP